MFYNLNLDDKSYNEIEEDAVFQIPGECPEWTNYNQSDPGIMMIGLLSWLKEIQQYHISQLSGWKRQKYLKLLGICMEHSLPAKGAVSVETVAGALDGQPALLKGTRFLAGDMVFETVQKERVYPIRLIGAYILCGEALERYVNIGNDLEKRMRLYPFGEQPEQGNCCCFVIDRAFAETGQTVVSFDICTEYQVTRNPIVEGFLPLAELRWEYQTEDGWEELIVDFDTTYAFLQSGKIGFHVPKKMQEDEKFGAWQIRVTLIENDYDVAPLIQNMYFNQIQVQQEYSYCDFEDSEARKGAKENIFFVKSGMYLAENGQVELYLEKTQGWMPLPILDKKKEDDGDVILMFERPDWAKEKDTLKCRLVAYEEEIWDRREVGVGDSSANQDYSLDIPDIVYDAFEIMVRDSRDGSFYPYRRTEDFDNCSSEDEVYVLDLAANKLLFGNCENGAAPDGEIRLLRLKVSNGKSGNIKAGKISECQAFPDLLVKQYEKTSGGRDNETTEECFKRLRRELRQVHRGVTYADYENLVKQAPGLLILDSKVVSMEGTGQEGVPENEISIVVRPLSYKQRDTHLSSKYRQNLERMLQKRKMIGTSIKILNPEYIGISIFAEIVIRPQFTDAEKMIEDAVRSYLDETSWEIGKTVSASAIYGIIDILPCVQQAKSLFVDAAGRGFRHLVNGDVKLPPNGLPYLKELDIRIYTAREANFIDFA